MPATKQVGAVELHAMETCIVQGTLATTSSPAAVAALKRCVFGEPPQPRKRPRRAVEVRSATPCLPPPGRGRGADRATGASKRRVGSPSQRQGGTFEARLFAALRQLLPEQRRMVLQQSLTEAQRLALERWMLARRTPQPQRRMLQPQLEKGGSCCQAVSTAKEGATSEGPAGGTAPNRPACAPKAPRCRKLRRPQPPPKRKQKQLGADGVERRPSRLPGGMQRCMKNGRPLYRAQVTVGPFRLTTRFDEDQPTVARFLEVLRAVRRRVQLAGGKGADDLAKAFSHAVVEEPRAHGLDASRDLGLCFVACVGAAYWIGEALCTPRFSVASLEPGLAAWCRLREARGFAYRRHTCWKTIQQTVGPSELAAAWARMRQTYIDMWVQSGHYRRATHRVCARLDAMEAKHRHRAKNSAGPSLSLLGAGDDAA